VTLHLHDRRRDCVHGISHLIREFVQHGCNRGRGRCRSHHPNGQG
jgi:hypothetical protein